MDEMYALGEKLLVIIPHFNTGKMEFSEPSVYHSNMYWGFGKESNLHKTEALCIRHFLANKEEKTKDR